MRRTSGSLIPHLHQTRCHAGVAPLLHTFLRPAAWGFAPQPPGRGPLHDGPLRSRVQGLCPLTPVAADIL